MISVRMLFGALVEGFIFYTLFSHEMSSRQHVAAISELQDRIQRQAKQITWLQNEVSKRCNDKQD